MLKYLLDIRLLSYTICLIGFMFQMMHGNWIYSGIELLLVILTGLGWAFKVLSIN